MIKSVLMDVFPKIISKQKFVDYCNFYNITDIDEIEFLKEDLISRGHKIKAY